jgi:integrase
MLTVAEAEVARLSAALEADPMSLSSRRLLFTAEQALLLVRVAADSGARRGELAVLCHSDVDGRVLTIRRGVSHGVFGSTKSNRSRRLTLGATTAGLIESHWTSWAERGPSPVDDWLFAPTPARATFLTADALSHKFRRHRRRRWSRTSGASPPSPRRGHPSRRQRAAAQGPGSSRAP